jgi:redox-sensitive bicupin YhaK (pirin superfamily)
MKKDITLSKDRGKSNFGWLDSKHTFSFGNYQDFSKMGFGLLRVINDDKVAPGAGFGTHPHANMEIVSIPLFGNLAHKDSTGREEVIKTGDVQIMSAGSGLTHSEYNYSNQEEVHFLQIWVRPKEMNIKPRYEQKSYNLEDRINNLQVVVAPNNENAVWINQDAWFSQIKLVENEFTYNINKSGNGVYIFVISGSVQVEGESLNARDGIGISDTDKIELKSNDAEILFMEVPMK